MYDRVQDDDLLRPSLEEEDDAVEFDRPWKPASLVFLTFFGGLLAGGVMLALNERRLGRSERYNPTMLIAVGATLLIYGVYSFLWATGAITRTEDGGDGERIGRIVVRAVSVGVAMFLSWRQSSRFRLAEMHDVELGKFSPMILAFILGNVGIMIMIFAYVFLFALLGVEIEA